MKMTLTKTAVGFVPHDDAREDFNKIKTGDVVIAEVRRQRNYKFHKKFFALVTLAYEYWAETMTPQDYKGTPVRPEFERFRKDLTILAGYFDPVYAIDGSVRLQAQSISFGNMDEDEFSKVYNAVLDTILEKVMRHVNKDELEAAVEQVMGFA